MAGKFFEVVTEEFAREIIAKMPNGWRFRTPPMMSKHNPYFVWDRKKAVCEAILSGEDRKAVAEKHKICMSTVEKILKENGIQPRKEKADTMVERIQLALKLKMPVTEIAKREGISRQRVYQIMKEKGIR